MSEAAVMRAVGEPLIIGRYALFDVLASGGMATVHLGRLLGPVGFGRTVAIKRLHAHFTQDQDFVTMFMDEAQIVARIRHPNVVPMVDVIESSKGIFLVMEYVHGESLSRLLRTCREAREPIPVKLLSTILHGVLLGLHAAHETKGADGELLDVVHRDVSPQNVIVGADGGARVLDFGVAKAAGRAQVTREGQIKGKLMYMAPEQIRGKTDRRSDVFSASVVLWEALAGRRFHDGAKDVEVVTRVVKGEFDPPSKHRPDLPPELDAITMRGLELDPDTRYPTARAMALDLERRVGLVSPSEVGEWVERLATEALTTRANMVSAMEMASGALVGIESRPPPTAVVMESTDAVQVCYATAHPSAPGFPIDPQTSANGMPPNGMYPYSSNYDPISAMQATPPGTELPIVDERSDLVPVIAILTFSGALLIAGIVLGALSLTAGKPSPSKAPPSSATSAPQRRPSAPPTVTAASAPASAHSPIRARPPPPAPANGSAPGVEETRSPPANTIVRPGVTTPATSPAPTPTVKNVACDPPYTVDDAGHRKYKRECMGEN